MSEQFKVGDICVGRGFVVLAHRNEMECEIIGGLEMRLGKCSITGKIYEAAFYDVRWSDGGERLVSAHNLRRKPPKQSDKGERRILELFVPVEEPEMVPG